MVCYFPPSFKTTQLCGYQYSCYESVKAEAQQLAPDDMLENGRTGYKFRPVSGSQAHSTYHLLCLPELCTAMRSVGFLLGSSLGNEEAQLEHPQSVGTVMFKSS